MGVLLDDLAWMYAESAFGASKLTFSGAIAWGYFDQEESLQSDGSSDSILVKRTVFMIQTPKTGAPLASLAADSAVTVYDPEREVSTSYVVSDKELVGDGRETRLILRPA